MIISVEEGFNPINFHIIFHLILNELNLGILALRCRTPLPAEGVEGLITGDKHMHVYVEIVG